MPITIYIKMKPDFYFLSARDLKSKKFLVGFFPRFRLDKRNKSPISLRLRRTTHNRNLITDLCIKADRAGHSVVSFYSF